MEKRWKTVAAAVLGLQVTLTLRPAVGAARPRRLVRDPAAIADSGNEGWMVKVGKLAPQFELEDVDGRRWKLSSLAERPVILFFWASW